MACERPGPKANAGGAGGAGTTGGGGGGTERTGGSVALAGWARRARGAGGPWSMLPGWICACGAQRAR